MAANVETMFYVSVVPWHGLGIKVDEALNSDDALKQAGLDWQVNPEPIFAQGVEIPGYKANMRSTDKSVLGIVSNQYKIVQNQEAFSFTDALIDTGTVTYETAGSLAGGKKVWLLAHLPQEKVLGDYVTPYLVFTNTFDGSGAVKVAMTPVRVVCQNTLNMALGSAKRTWATKHMGDMTTKMKEAQRTLGLAESYMKEFKVQADILAGIKVSRKKFEKIVDLLIPADAKDGVTEQIESYRESLIDTYAAEDLENIKGTGWGVVNSISDWLTHVKPLRDSRRSKERRFESAINGFPMLQEAYDILLEMKAA